MATHEEHKQHANVGDKTVKEVAKWVANDIGLPMYKDAFEGNHIDGDALKVLDKDDLIDLGIKSVGHRIKILTAIASIQQVANIAHRNKVLLDFTEHYYCCAIFPRQYKITNTFLEVRFLTWPVLERGARCSTTRSSPTREGPLRRGTCRTSFLR